MVFFIALYPVLGIRFQPRMFTLKLFSHPLNLKKLTFNDKKLSTIKLFIRWEYSYTAERKLWVLNTLSIKPNV